jgi:SAM-dependent methyltransferase
MSEGPEHDPETAPDTVESPAAPVAPARPAAPVLPMRAMRVISVGADSVSAPYSPGPDSAELGEGAPHSDARAEAPPPPTPAEEPVAIEGPPAIEPPQVVEPVQGPAEDFGPEVSEHEEELGEEEFEEDESTPALSEEDLEDSFSEEPPPVVPRSQERPLPLVSRGPRAPEAEAPSAAAETQAERKVQPPSPPPRSQRPALPSAKPRRKPWWEEAFGDDFSRAHRPLTERQLTSEADFIERTLELQKGAVVLDLCCGQGQHAIELSRRGFPVVGYDLSVFQLAVAADYAQTARQKINFLQGDMREMAFDAMFDAMLCWDTSFGYFEEDKNVEVARRMFAALKPGGSLLLDIMNRDFAAREAPCNHWFEGDGCICMDDMSLDWITSRLKVKRSVILDDGRSKELTYSIRLYNLSEIGKILHDAGFLILSVSGHPSTPGAFLGSRSPRLIIRAQRPD